MPTMKNKKIAFNKAHLQVAGVLLLILFAVLLLWFLNSNSTQALPALLAKVYFEGEYSIDGGEPQRIVEGEHIPATKGDVTLRGNFHMTTPDGEYVGIYRGEIPIAFYINHINLTFYEVGTEPYSIDMENPLYGSSACGVNWTAHTLVSAPEEEVVILVNNPHAFGNETAIDEMLAGISLWADIDFEKDAMKAGETERYAGLLLMIVSLVFFGTALFSTLIHIGKNRIVWLLGLVVLCAGIYFAYGADGVSFWSDSVSSNTTLLGFSLMFYMLFLLMSIASFLKTTKRVGNLIAIILGAVDAVLLLLPILSGNTIRFYDTWAYWGIVQIAANAVLAGCLIKDFLATKARDRWFYIGALLPLICFGIDVLGVWVGFLRDAVASKYIFVILFAIAAIVVLRFIPQSINAAAKAKELEMEKIVLNAQLAESRISTMMSQIRPHFIYNTLGSIEQLCHLDPPKAGELVHDFAKYLRGNFGELDNPKPILMTQEMEHVHHYVSIENVRFPDMTFSFEMNSVDFHIPALTIQPIVENAIKHGLMKLQKGGTIHVVSYETDTHYCVSVEDDGVGFDTGALLDERKHVGLRNIRERLKVMVDGTMEIESTEGVGTKVLITIPKEVRK